MRVLVEDAVFGAADSQLDLFALMRLAHQGRHCVLPFPETGSCFTDWRDALTATQRELVETAIKSSLDRESRQPARLSLRIHASPAAVPAKSPSFTLAEALLILEEPFRILVENHINDRAFLIAAASPEDREALLQAEEQKWLRFENAGGIDGIRNLFTVTHASGGLADPRQRLRVFVVFDSDRLAPALPSKKSDQLTAMCCEQGLSEPRRFYQLTRRCIENYLPVRALEDWRSSTKGKANKAAIFAAWQSLTPEQAHFFNMKGGFKGDSEHLRALKTRGHEISAFEHEAEHRNERKLLLILTHYQDLPADVLSSLIEGFDPQIGKDFEAKAAWYQQHPSWRIEAGLADEFDALFRDLLGAL